MRKKTKEVSPLVWIMYGIMLILTITPLFIYIKTSIGYFTSKEVLIYATVFFIEFLFVWIAEITNIADVQVTLKITHVLLALGLIIIFSLIFRKKETSDVYINSAFYMRLRKIGMIVLF